MRVLAVIPARFASTRLRGKPLLPILGKPLIQHVYEGVFESSLIEKTIVATDNQEILDLVFGFGGQAIMTNSAHPTGTDRLCEVAQKEDWADIILNIQGDELLVDETLVKNLLEPFKRWGNKVSMSTLKRKLTTPEEINDSNNVKVISDKNDRAIYFSRSPIPFDRNGHHPDYFLHIGLYGYRRDFLLQYPAMPRTQLEISESLEQLRAIENGFSIYVKEINQLTVDVNVEKDIQKAEAALLAKTKV